MRDLSHMQRTKGEAINSGVSPLRKDTPNGAHKYSVFTALPKFFISSIPDSVFLQHHGRRKPGPHSCVLGKYFQSFIPSSTERFNIGWCVAHRHSLLLNDQLCLLIISNVCCPIHLQLWVYRNLFITWSTPGTTGPKKTRALNLIMPAPRHKVLQDCQISVQI